MTSALRRAVSALALTGVVFTAGCTIGDEEQAQEERVPARSLTMAFGGDVMFESHLRSLAYDEDSLSELKSTLGAADLSVTIDVPASDEEADGPLVSDAEWTPMLIGYDGIPRPAEEVAGQATADQLTSLTEGYRSCTPASATRDGKAASTTSSATETGATGSS